MTLKSKDRSWADRLHFLLCWLNLHFWIVRKQSDKNPRRKECVVCGESEKLPIVRQRRARERKTQINNVEPPTADEMLDEPDTNPRNEMVGGDL